MGINEDVIALRQKMAEAVRSGFIDEGNKGTYEMTLLQIMNEAERQRQNCAKRAETLKMQAATAEGQSAAFGMISSIVNSIVNSMVKKTIKNTEEEEELKKQEEEANKEKEELKKELAESQAKPKPTRRKTTKRTSKKTTAKKT